MVIIILVHDFQDVIYCPKYESPLILTMTYNLFSGQEIGEEVYFLLSVCVMYHLYINFPKHEDLSPYLTENRL